MQHLLEPKVTIEDEQIPLEITEIDSKVDLKITAYKKGMEIIDLQVQLDGHLSIEMSIQIMHQNSDVDYPSKLK